MRNKKLVKEILNHFKRIAPSIVKESITRSATGNPKIDLYDEDFYLDQIKEYFSEIETQTIQKIIGDHKLKIDNIFLENYKSQIDQ